MNVIVINCTCCTERLPRARMPADEKFDLLHIVRWPAINGHWQRRRTLDAQVRPSAHRDRTSAPKTHVSLPITTDMNISPLGWGFRDRVTVLG